MKSRIWLSTQDSGFFDYSYARVTVFTEAKRACNRETCYSLWKKIHDKLLLRSIERASSNKCSQSLADMGKEKKKRYVSSKF